MSKLVVDEIQYSGGTALTLPTATPVANDQLKTDGSGNLGWTNYATSIKRPNVTYTFPAAAGSANQALKTDGSGNMDWANAPANPMYNVGNSTNRRYGYYLLDKVDCVSTPASANINFNFPSSYVTNTASMIGIYLKVIGLGNVTNGDYPYMRFVDNSGNSVHQNTQNMAGWRRTYGQGAGASDWQSSNSSYIESSNAMNQSMFGTSTVAFNDTSSTTQYGKGCHMHVYAYMGNAMPSVWWAYGASESNNQPFGMCGEACFIQNQYNGWRALSSKPYGVQITSPNGTNWNDGMVEMYGIMQDANVNYP